MVRCRWAPQARRRPEQPAKRSEQLIRRAVRRVIACDRCDSTLAAICCPIRNASETTPSPDVRVWFDCAISRESELSRIVCARLERATVYAYMRQQRCVVGKLSRRRRRRRRRFISARARAVSDCALLWNNCNCNGYNYERVNAFASLRYRNPTIRPVR